MQALIQLIIHEALQLVVMVLVFAALTAVAALRKRIEAWFGAHTTASQRATLHLLASEAMAYAETVFAGKGGPDKFEAAYGYVSSRLRQMGLDVSEMELRGVIEKSVQDYNAKTKKPPSS